MYRIEDLPARLAAKIWVNPETGCWEWQAPRNPKGYGRVQWDGQQRQAHRVVYTLLVAPIPDELTLDHVKARGCRSKACCWPVHLEPVTDLENGLRAGGGPAVNAVKTHCTHGHEFDPLNTRIRPSGRRECRECERARERRRGGPGRARGAAHGRARLTENDVRDIRRRRAEGELLGQLAAAFGVGSSTISHVVARETWAHIPPAGAFNGQAAHG